MSAADELDALRTVIERELPQWLTRQRWYSGGAAITSVHCTELAEIASDPRVLFAMVAVRSADGGEALYNVPLAVSGHGGLRPSDPGAVLHEDGESLVFDALASAASAQPLWRILAGRQTVAVPGGRLTGGGAGLDPAITDINPLVREQSNSSLLVGSEHLLKVMRRVVFQPSVELEMTRALAAGGFQQVPVPEGWLHHERHGEAHGALLALVQRFLRNGSEGWTLALTSLRDLYADVEEEGVSADAAQRVQAVEDQGSSFTPDAARLGDLTARMHLALASATGTEMAAVPITAAMLGRWASEIDSELDELLSADNPLVQGLSEHAAALRARVGALRGVAAAGLAIRIHGDYHLGQVLRTDAGWTVLDFEGEPLRPVEERRRTQSPMRDVAGMLRSFDYAAAVGLTERAIVPGSAEWLEMAPQGRSWATANRDAFWTAYLERAAGTELVPDAGAALGVRRAFEIAKAVYEVRYELAHRPAWVSIPLAFLLEAA